MTARTDYIAHCESLGIHRSLAELMADACARKSAFPQLRTRGSTASIQVRASFVWEETMQGFGFWQGIANMLDKMAKTGECK